MRQAEDIILRDFLLSSVSQYNCKGGTDGDNPTEMTPRDLSAVASSLDTSNAFKFLSGKQGENRFGTAPIRSAYFLLCSTELQPTFDAMDKFTSSEAAVQRGASMNGNDVYNNMAVARESYAHIDQDGYSSQLLYRPPIFSGPLALNGTLGVKFAQAQAILQETWIRNVRCTQPSM